MASQATAFRRELEPSRDEAWPDIPLDAWADTRETLHRWTQIVGKTRLTFAPPVNHWWHATLYVTPRGLTTSAVPYGSDTFEVLFDFVDHEVHVLRSTGEGHAFALRSESVAAFYARYAHALESVGVRAPIWTTPVEIEDRIPFEEDFRHCAYDAEAAHRFWVSLTRVHNVLCEFRSGFLGKVSPVHFFWGAFDLAVTRFSGRRAPTHSGVPYVAPFVPQEAYSHEVSSAGFWPGGGGYDAPAVYSYAYPEPEGFSRCRVEPEAAFYHDTLREFILPYDAVRISENPRGTLLGFLQTTYEAAANLGKWDRAALECDEHWLEGRRDAWKQASLTAGV